jgi:hypothetical protein
MKNSVTVFMPTFSDFANRLTNQKLKAKTIFSRPEHMLVLFLLKMTALTLRNRMAEIHRELLSLQAESNDLMDTISKNMEEMGL